MTILIDKPLLDAVDKGDIKVMASIGQEVPELPDAYDITRDDLVRDQPQTLTKFVKAELKGLRWAQANPEPAATIAEKYIKDVPHALMTQALTTAAKIGVYGLDGGFTMDGIDKTQKLYLDLGVIKQTVKPEDVATRRFVDDALKDLK